MMKRYFALLVISIMFVLPLTGCGKQTQTITSSHQSVGSYSLFQTDNVNEYLEFLETFDEEHYTIINIDTFLREVPFSYDDDFYMITYKKIK